MIKPGIVADVNKTYKSHCVKEGKDNIPFHIYWTIKPVCCSLFFFS